MSHQHVIVVVKLLRAWLQFHKLVDDELPKLLFKVTVLIVTMCGIPSLQDARNRTVFNFIRYHGSNMISRRWWGVKDAMWPQSIEICTQLCERIEYDQYELGKKITAT